jgi:predicted lipid-binding transport protein (Tim44 family)
MLKNSFLILLSLLAITGGSVFAITAHRDYVAKQTAQAAHSAAVAAQNEAKEQADQRAQEQRVQDEMDKLRLACEEGSAAYGALSISQQARFTEPDCGL